MKKWQADNRRVKKTDEFFQKNYPTKRDYRKI